MQLKKKLEDRHADTSTECLHFLKHQHHKDPGNDLEELLRKQSKSHFTVKSSKKTNFTVTSIRKHSKSHFSAKSSCG